MEIESSNREFSMTLTSVTGSAVLSQMVTMIRDEMMELRISDSEFSTSTSTLWNGEEDGGGGGGGGGTRGERSPSNINNAPIYTLAGHRRKFYTEARSWSSWSAVKAINCTTPNCPLVPVCSLDQQQPRRIFLHRRRRANERLNF